jgi:hypothetical protein
MTEDRGQRTDDRDQRTEVRDQMTEIPNSFTFSMRYALCSMPFIGRITQRATCNP